MMRRTLLLSLVCLLILSTVALAAETADPEYGGVGLQVVPTSEGELVVLRVVEGSSAAANGLLPGDLVYQVDGNRLKGSEFGRVIADYLWGAVGSTVTISYRRPGVAGNHEVVLKRGALSPQLTVTPGLRE